MHSALSIFFAVWLGLFQSPEIILITLDGVRWQEIYQGTDSLLYKDKISSRELFPNLYNRFVDQGIAIGATEPMVASGPNFISLPGYLEITRGYPSSDCQTNSCDPILHESIFFWFNSAAVFSSWQNIRKAVPNKDYIYIDIESKYRKDYLTEKAAIDYLNCHDPNFIWISFGDMDEWAHANNYNNYLESLKYADKFIGVIVNKYPNSNIIITTDHGRSYDFKSHGRDKVSQRVWLMMRGPRIPSKGLVNIKSSLSDINPTILDIKNNFESKQSILVKLKGL